VLDSARLSPENDSVSSELCTRRGRCSAELEAVVNFFAGEKCGGLVI
jgi:hypothetical protein